MLTLLKALRIKSHEVGWARNTSREVCCCCFFAMQMLGLYRKPISPPNGWGCVLVRRSKHWKVGDLWLNAIEQDKQDSN